MPAPTPCSRSVTYTLGANVENLVLTGVAAINGTGNALNNILTGNAGNNTLDGGLGADLMAGGLGNDIYVVDNAGDVVSEAAGAGTDTVRSSVTYTLGANVENLMLTGVAAINGTGNALNNILTGNAGNNTAGRRARRRPHGGRAGNDTYVVDNAGDVVSEAASAGTDTVQSSVTYTLGDNVENLTLTGAGGDQRHRQRAEQHPHRQRRQQHPGRRARRRHAWRAALGNDTYVVDNAGDVVSEAAGPAPTPCGRSVTYTLGGQCREPDADRGGGDQRHRQRAEQQRSPATPATTRWTAGVGADTHGGRARQRHLRGRQRRRRGERGCQCAAPTPCGPRSPTRWRPMSRTWC